MNLGIFTGVAFDFGLTIIGCIVGSFMKTELLGRIGNRIFQTFAILILAMGISSAIDLSNIYLILLSVIVGVAFGEVMNLDRMILKAGVFIEDKISKFRSKDNFTKAFTQSMMVFCVGSMTIMGALQSGISNSHSILFTKGFIDGVTAITLTMGLGRGVFLGTVPMLIYETLLVIGAGYISPLMTGDVTGAFNAVGGLLLIAIALNLLNITELKVINLMPAMFIPILYEAVIRIIG